jgi:acyl-CoA synthetase (AMP-forming)/AMP-acid ligase II/NAD(P)-dependent dehydrogenase (short-subunit alcohol dehydrogenase family)
VRTELIRPLPELIEVNATRVGDRLAFADAGRSVTHAELARRTARLAGHLAEHGLRPGGRAAVALPGGVDMVECCLAITRAGGICVPLDLRAPADELAYLLADSGATLVITDARGQSVIETAGSRGTRRTVLVTGADAPARRSVDRLATTDAPPPRDDLDLTEPAWLMYTSGTTGPPKGVLTSQRNCLWSVAACYAPILGLSAADHLLCPLPLHHSLAQVLGVVGTIATGAAATLADGITADAVLDALRTGRHTFLVGAPTLYADLLRRADQPARAAISRLRVCLSTGAIAAPALSAEFAETFGVPLLNSYGATETAGPITVSWTDGGTPGGSAGLPVPGLAVRVVDPATGDDLSPGEEGEVLVRGPNLMIGYHDRPEASDDALRGGWYRTGDLACLDADGHLRINGRLAELITTGGERTHPEEIEAVLRAVPGVADAAVVGRPHEVLGEIPVAFVAPGPAGFDQDRVLAACSRELPRAKVPVELFEIDAVPRSRSGKVARHRLHTLPAKLRAVGGTHYEQLFRLDWTPLLDRGAMRAAPRVVEFGEQVDRHAPLPDLVVLRAPADVSMAGALAVAEQITTWLTHPWPPGARLAVVTTTAVNTYPGERVAGLGAPALWGLATAAQSDADDRLLVIDTDTALGGEAIATLGALGRPRLAVRGGIPLVPQLARVGTEQTGGVRLRQAGTVLVTGGTAGLGRELAKHLVTAHGVRSLLLTTPTGPGTHPDRFTPDPLARPEVTVRTAAVDHADRAALAALLAGIPKEAPLTAVVHAAGLDPGGPLATAVAEDPAAALHRRITPAVHLHELTTGLDLAAFVLVSTAGGTAPGNAATTAVDACLGAIAGIRHLTGQQALSLSVGVIGETGLSPQEAMAMFDAALRAGVPRLITMRPVDSRTPGSHGPFVALP